jgi:hypothetical protein
MIVVSFLAKAPHLPQPALVALCRMISTGPVVP